MNALLLSDQNDVLNLKVMLDVSFNGNIGNLLKFLGISSKNTELQDQNDGVPDLIRESISDKLELDISSSWFIELDDEYGNPLDISRSPFYKMSRNERLLNNAISVLNHIFNDDSESFLAFINIYDINWPKLVAHLENGEKNQYTYSFEDALSEAFGINSSVPLSASHLQYLMDSVGPTLQVDTTTEDGGSNNEPSEHSSEVKSMKKPSSESAFVLDSFNPYDLYKAVQEEYNSSELSDDLKAGFETYCKSIIDTIRQKHIDDPTYLSSSKSFIYSNKFPAAFSIEKYIKTHLLETLASFRVKSPSLRESFTENFFVFMKKKFEMACIRADDSGLLSECAPAELVQAKAGEKFHCMPSSFPFEVIDILYNVYGLSKGEKRYYHGLPFFTLEFEEKYLITNLGLQFKAEKLNELYCSVVKIGDKLILKQDLTESDLVEVTALMGSRVRYDHEVPKTLLVLIEYVLNGITKTVEISKRTGVAQGNVSRTISRYKEHLDKAEFAARVFKQVYSRK